jgi:glycosyltransferase involved in cell wall biosynthesis
MQKVSYVFPIYNEAGNIDLLYRTMSDLLAPLTKEYTFELVFVNDGSADNSLELLSNIQSRDPRVVVVDFSRNFGHQMAVTAGLDIATGDAVIIMDSDMQDPPSVSLELIDKWREGYDVVYAQRRSRKDSVFKKLTAFLFYWLLSHVADIKIPRDTADFRLLDRKVVDALKQFHERSRFLRGMVSYVGFKQIGVLYDRHERYAGSTGYPLKKMLRFAADGVLGFSMAPLKAVRTVGYIVSCLSLIGILYALYVRLFTSSTAVPGWTFTVIAILFVGGVQIVMLSIVGSYIGRIYAEAQNRPLYIVNKVYRHEAKVHDPK